MQPMKMKQSINCILLIVSVWMLDLHFLATDQYNYTVGIWDLCGNRGKNEFTNGSVFQGSLNQVLDSLVGKVPSTRFNTSCVDDGRNNNSSVYGLL